MWHAHFSAWEGRIFRRNDFRSMRCAGPTRLYVTFRLEELFQRILLPGCDPVAQWIERELRKPKVGGSNPPRILKPSEVAGFFIY